MTWKVGDLGRFSMENNKRPRFEVLKPSPDRGIAIWYGGSQRPVWVPQDVFKAKCVPHWDIEVVPTLPKWLAPKAIFSIYDARASNLTQAVIKSGYSQHTEQIDVRNHDLMVRRIRYDHASCFDDTAKCLVMVPLKTIAQYGEQVMTVYDHLMGEDPFGEDGDEIEDLLRSL